MQAGALLYCRLRTGYSASHYPCESGDASAEPRSEHVDTAAVGASKILGPTSAAEEVTHFGEEEEMMEVCSIWTFCGKKSKAKRRNHF